MNLSDVRPNLRAALTYGGATDRRLMHLLEVRNGLRNCYARDLLDDLLHNYEGDDAPGWASDTEADSLFRTLVLDEEMAPRDANEVIQAALVVHSAEVAIREEEKPS